MPRAFASFPLLIPAAALLWSSAAAAAEPVPAPRPTPEDTRRLRPTIAAQIGWQRLFGSAEEGRKQANVTSWGAAPELQLALPLSREWAPVIWGGFANFSTGSSQCPSCRGETFFIGGGLQYHLLDGVPFDPWFAGGTGYRQTKLTFDNELAEPTQFTYSGLDIFRFQLAADYYFMPQAGIGMYMDYGVGVYGKRNPGSIPDSGGAIHSTFTFGLRLVLSPLGTE